MSNFGVSALTTSTLAGVKALSTRKAFIQDYLTQHTLVQVDASISETHSITAPPTKFPIESGQNVTDNFIVEPFALDMTGMISDDPVSLIGSAVTTGLSTVLPASGIIAGSAAIAVFNVLNGTKKPSVANFNQFVNIVVNKRTVNIYTTLNFYKSMWLSSLRVDRDSQHGNALMFKASFIQVILVKPQVVNVAKYSNPALSASQANLGKAQSGLSGISQAAFTDGRVTGVTNANGAFNFLGAK